MTTKIFSDLKNSIKVFAGSSADDLAEKACRILGIELGKILRERFSDGEHQIQLQENIRNKYVFIIQSTGPDDAYLIELMLLIDAARRSSAEKIAVIVPYYGYARQDRKDKPRVPISARVVADAIESQLPTRILFCDLHTAAIPGFFKIPSDHIYARPTFVKFIKDEFTDRLDNIVFVAADVGATKMCRSYAQRLKTPIAIIDKRRPRPNRAEVLNIIGEVKGKYCIILDDLIDTAGTITGGAEALVKNGAKKVFAMATHPVLSGSAIERINNSPLEWLAVSDTIPLKKEVKDSKKLRVISLASVFAEAISRIYSGESLSALFD
ncbi:ribose-phosphate pyrophosphokinase [Patescibacteria group bacterium AH-259-L07]|nr:ribose-phosphate pyrophosphokinase [Patescibacteria group bacterium AH-259-L07]